MLHEEGRTSERVVNARGGSGMKRPDEAKRMRESERLYEELLESGRVQ